VLSFYPMKSFLGADVTFGSDLNLIVQLIIKIAARHWSHSREAEAFQSSRHLPDDGAFFEPSDDRAGDVAVVPATNEALSKVRPQAIVAVSAEVGVSNVASTWYEAKDLTIS